MKSEAPTKILKSLHIRERKLAHGYIVYAIKLVEADQSCLEHITKTVYVDVAEKYHTSVYNVERGIRNAVEAIWKNKSKHEQLLLEIFGAENMDYRPTNTQFLSCLYNYLVSQQADSACDKKCPGCNCEFCAKKQKKTE